MKARLTTLSEEERKIIDAEALQVLEEVGVQFPGEMALSTLEAGGARVDYDRQVAYIGRDMVANALRTAPKEILFGARDPAQDVVLPRADALYNLDGCGVYAWDYGASGRRDAVLQDVANAAKVFDTLDFGNICWPPISPSDVPQGPRSIVSAFTCYRNTSKHVQDEVKTRAEVPYVAEISAILAGGRDRVKERNMYSVTYCTVAPLTHDQEMLEATMDLSRHGAPINIYPMPASGTTGPGSLFYNLVTGIAEALSAVVVFQLYSPGCPLVMGSAIGSVNVRTGSFLEGMPETVLQLCGSKEMADYYGLPSIIAGCISDAKMPGIQSAIEKVLTSLPLVLIGTDVVQGIGMLESSMTLSLEQILIDAEIARLNARLRAGIEVVPEKNLFDDVAAVGPGGHFLKQKSTRRLFRSDEFYGSALLDRGTYEEWQAGGGLELTDKAHAQVVEILAAEQRCPMDPLIEKQILEVVEEAKAKLS
ncbi:MAG: trimethylamine methyltransferase family protein [Clostridiales Family XIII bacterium]|jgi:trimethylamine--corrinoid protein Co-methyltransferase|nr:trimethylamine methyltransferase family protein [Clostridiales Family XIII bacterium]